MKTYRKIEALASALRAALNAGASKADCMRMLDEGITVTQLPSGKATRETLPPVSAFALVDGITGGYPGRVWNLPDGMDDRPGKYARATLDKQGGIAGLEYVTIYGGATIADTMAGVIAEMMNAADCGQVLVINSRGQLAETTEETQRIAAARLEEIGGLAVAEPEGGEH